MKLANVIFGVVALMVLGLQSFAQAQSVEASTPDSSSVSIQSADKGATDAGETAKVEGTTAVAFDEDSAAPQTAEQQPKANSTGSSNGASGNANSTTNLADAPVASSATHAGFFRRFGKAYRDDWFPPAASGPTADAPHRGYAAPVDGPPFPFSDWPYGGSPVIGATWTQSGPLMQALWTGPHGDAWKKSGIQIYGWLNGGFNISSSNKPGYANLPTAYAEKPNSFQPDQQVLYVERQPNTVQIEHFDWGFRVASLYGIDYRFTTAKGIASSQLLKHNREYGYDPVMFYTDLYWGQVAQGLNVRIGRYISLPDIEAQLAPNNYTYTHSLLYSYDCYTQTGVNATLKVSKGLLLQGGLSAGCEATPWTKSPDAQPTLNLCASYTFHDGKDNVYPCLNALNNGKYGYNNLNSVYNTWYHKFSPTVHMSTEAWYMWQRQVPNVNNPASAGLIETNAPGAVCDNATARNCYAPEWAVLNYVEKELNKKNYISVRNEYFDDMKGQRTGFKTRYTEHMVGLGHWIGSTMLFRPEIRYERSYDVPAYDNGTKKNQLMLAGDIIVFF